MAFYGEDEPDYRPESPEDPEDLSLMDTPEGRELEPLSLWQRMEDARAQAQAEVAWRFTLQERRKVA